MANQGYSRPNGYNGYDHYDKNGNKIGSSFPSGDGFKEYDENHRQIGYSRPNSFGGFTHYDNNGKVTGSDRPNSWGGIDHFDANGNKIGTSSTASGTGFSGYRTTGTSQPGRYTFLADKGTERQRGIMEYENENTGGGCYIATCVYGSYDCPQVWTLRRFRDHTLKRTAPGRAFVRCYYALSPTLVRKYGDITAFRVFWRKVLDRMVGRLNENGVVDTRYEDS